MDQEIQKYFKFFQIVSDSGLTRWIGTWLYQQEVRGTRQRQGGGCVMVWADVMAAVSLQTRSEWRNVFKSTLKTIVIFWKAPSSRSGLPRSQHHSRRQQCSCRTMPYCLHEIIYQIQNSFVSQEGREGRSFDDTASLLADLNPNEHFWALMKLDVYAGERQHSSLERQWEALSAACSCIQ